MTNWSQKRPGAGKFTPEDVNPSLCTHIIYAFATLKDHKLAESSSKDLDMYDRVIALRDNNPDLKVKICFDKNLTISIPTNQFFCVCLPSDWSGQFTVHQRLVLKQFTLFSALVVSM